MAQTVQLKRSSVPGKVPTTSDLALGEIAINTYDGKVFTKKDNGTPSIVEIGAGGVGVTNLSATANSSSVVVVSDTGNDATLVAANSTTAGVLTADAQTIGGVKTFSSNVALQTVTSGLWNGSVIGPTYGGTGVNNGASTITLSGNLTTSGAFATTLTVTGATNVTLPTTGTLATLAGSETLSSKTLSGAVLTGTLTANSSVGTAGQVLATSGTGTYWVTPGGTRVASFATATSITINSDTTDMAIMTNTQAAGAFTINAPTGTPLDGQKLMFRLKSTNVQTFSWNAIFTGSTDLALPTASSGATLTDYFGFIYNSSAAKWQVVARNFGF